MPPNSKKLNNGHSNAETIRNTEALLNLPTDQLLAYLSTSESGLTSENAGSRIETYGYNEITQQKKRTAVVEFLSHIGNPLIVILLIASLISIIVGEITDAVIIFSVVLISVTLDFYQEFKAEKATELLKKKVATTVSVIRDGVKQEIKLLDVVPGDIVLLSAGDIVPADARVINAKDLFVDQSMLTGESFPVEKTIVPSQVKAKVASEWNNYIFMGSSITSGTATAVVLKTGRLTEYGKIADRLGIKKPETEFDKGLRQFSFLIMQITFSLVIFVFFINALYKHGILDSLLFSVALAVGLTPELLPMIISVNLSKGALSMSKKGVIVKRLASIQNFGSMNVLCTDKTGTLTENRVEVILHEDIDGKEDDRVLLYSYLNSYYQTGLKSPLDDAVLKFKDLDVMGYKKIDEVPFDFTRKRTSVVVELERERFFIAKGAPEEIIKVCSYCELDDKIFDLRPDLIGKIEERYYKLSSEGFRVLGVSYIKLKEDKPVYSINDEYSMIFLGFIAFIDPPKETAKESLQLLNKAGIELKILTGDNELVTRKTCEQLGFAIKGVVLGDAVEKMGDSAIARIIEEANIFARVTPSQKNKIINTLKISGHCVGFIGDGMNDAPSLKTADVGISVDNAVDVAKESADIILLKKDLTVLGEAVIEGRKTFGNTTKYINMATSSNFGNMFSVAGGSLFLPFLPMLPIQILLNNLLYSFAQLAIPTDNVDSEYVDKPKTWDIPLIRRFMLFFGPISSIFDFLTFFIMLLFFKANPPLFQTAWFIESLTTQSLIIFAIRTKKTPFYKSKPSMILVLSTLLVVVFGLILPFTPLSSFFQFERPPFSFYLVLVVLLIAYFIFVEIVKKWFYRRYSGV